jgi:hypothetical protein
MKIKLAVFLSLISVLGLAQTDVDGGGAISPEAYLEYIKSENASVRQQITELQKTIQEERSSHYAFVEGVYRWTAIGVSVLAVVFGALLVFIGWNASNQVRKDFEQIMKEKVRDPAILEKLLAIVEAEISLEKGRFSFLADESLSEKLSEEVKRLGQRGIKATLIKPSEPIDDFDVIIYRFNPANPEQGEDYELEKLIDKLKTAAISTPLVIYAPNRLWVKGTTSSKLDSYPLHHMASNIIGLIDNVSSAYRVSRLKPYS